MKLLLCLGALLAAALATTSSSSWMSRPMYRHQSGGQRAFRAGQHYIFDFDGQVSTGLPIPGASHSAATRLQAVVSLVFSDDRVALLQIQKIRVGAAQKDLTEPRSLQPFGVFQEIELTQKQQHQLRLPLRFRYEQGLVSEMEFDGDDQAWSENIKRAIVNMLQVNMAKKSRTDKNEMTRVLRDDVEDMSISEMNNDFFTTQETILEGDCETAYTIVPLQESSSDSEKEQLSVSKSVNYDKCTRRVDVRYNFRFGEECPAAEKKFYGDEQNTESATVINFKLLGTGHDFVIRESELRSHYVFAPFDKKQQIAATYVAAKLTLVDVNSERASVEQPKNVQKKQTLVYSSEWEEKLELFRMTGNEQLLSDAPFTWIHKKIEIARQIVSQLAKEMLQDEQGGDFQLEQNHQVARLVEVLRVATKEELKKIAHEFVKYAEEGKPMMGQKLKDIYFDILAIAGTQPAIEILAEKIAERQISITHAASLLKLLVNVQTPSEQMVATLIRLAKESSVDRQPVLKQSVWLTIGALMNGVCGSEKRDCHAREVSYERRHQICTRQTKQMFVEELEKLYERASSRYEKILAIKTGANAGFDLVVFPLEKLISDEGLERMIRAEAISALRQLRFVMPRKIQNILMPIFKNVREAPVLRMYAFHHIMQTLPQRHVIDQITQQLEKEPSHQVHTYVYSALKALVKSTIPCEQTMKSDIEHSLRLTRVQPRKMFDSIQGRATFYNDEMLMGASINWASLFGSESVLPHEITASLETVFGGSWHKYLAQIGFHQHNLDAILFKMLDKLEMNEQDDVVVRGKRSLMNKPSDMLRQMMQKMGIKHRRQMNMDSDPHAMIYIRYRDLDYALLPIDQESLPTSFWQMLENGKLDISEIERYLARGIRFNTAGATFVTEITRLIPTTLGIPVEMSAKMPTVFSIDGELKAELEPRSSSNVYGGRILINALPKIATTHVWHMELRTPFVSQGFKLLHSAQLNVPVNLIAEMKWGKTFDIKTIIKAPQQQSDKQRIVLLHSRPVTYIRLQNSQHPFAQEHTVFVPSQPRQQLQKTYGEQALGVRFDVVGNVHRHVLLGEIAPSKVIPVIVTENHLEVIMRRGQDQPREYVVRMTVAAFDEESKMERPDFEGFFQKDNENVFETDELDWSNEFDKEEEKNMNYKPLRRTHEMRTSSFSKYTNDYASMSQVGYKHRIYVKAEALGASRERKAEFELRTKCDDTLTFCKWNIDAMRTPVLSTESSNWLLRLSAQTLFPEPINTLQQLASQTHRELQATIESEWGVSGMKNMINMKIQVEQSREQQAWLRAIARMPQLEKLEYAEEYELLPLAGRLNQFKIVADYKLSEKTLAYADKWHALLHSMQPWMSEVQMLKSGSGVYNKNGRMVATMNVEPRTWRYANITLETPSEQLRLSDVYLPIRPTFLSIERVMPIRGFKQLGRKMAVGGFKGTQSTCQVGTSKVATFDDVIYSVPLTTCYSVLAKDCSGASPKFAVLMKKLESGNNSKKLKIITDEVTIEVEKKNDGDLRIKVNGELMNSQSSLRKYNIEKRGERVIIFDNDDVFVRFDGIQADIRVNELYKRQQCGLCGNYDGEYEGEFRAANGEETDDMEKFHRSFLTTGDSECEMEESELSKKTNYKKFGVSSLSRFDELKQNKWEQSSEEDSSDSFEDSKDLLWNTKRMMFNEHDKYNMDKFDMDNDEDLNTFKSSGRLQNKKWMDRNEDWGFKSSGGFKSGARFMDDMKDEGNVVEPERKTKVLEYSNRICFSKHPVPVCPRKTFEKTEEEQTKQMKITFACLPRTEPEARRMLREAKESKVVEVEHLSESFVETYTVPKTCVVY